MTLVFPFVIILSLFVSFLEKWEVKILKNARRASLKLSNAGFG